MRHLFHVVLGASLLFLFWGTAHAQQRGPIKFSQEEEPQKEQIQQEILEERQEVTLLKIVGGLGIQTDEHAHPSSHCHISKNRHALANHTLEADDYHQTVSKTKEKEWPEFAEVEKKVTEASEAVEQAPEELEQPKSPSIHYVAMVQTLLKVKIQGQVMTGIGDQKAVPLYSAGKKLQKNDSEAAKWLIEYIDKNCPNDKPFKELTGAN